jgi:hypothetical protein
MSHVTTAQLIELFCGDAADGDAIDAHVFDCDACGATYARLGELCASLRSMVPPVVSHAHRDRMLARGTPLLETPVQAGVPVEVTFSLGLELLVHKLTGDFAGASRVDLAIVGPNGEPGIVLEHVPFSATEVLIACQRHYRDVFPGDPTFVLTVTAGETTRKASYLVVHHFPEQTA